MFQLRDYQQTAITSLFNYLEENPGQNPCLVAPTGAGKSYIIAGFIRQTLEMFPHLNFLILAHQKELILQDARALMNVYPEASIGIYSASANMKELGYKITYASIQSIANVANLERVFGDCIVLVDECHRINNDDNGQYRMALSIINPRFVIGLSATPFRLGQGLVTDGENAVFSDILETILISDLQKKGFLAYLKSKSMINEYYLEHVKKNSKGDYVLASLQTQTQEKYSNVEVVEEFVKTVRHLDRQHVLIFCTGIKHAETVKELLAENGETNVSFVHGKLTQEERDIEIKNFTSGINRYVVNVDILTTGFDFPNIDCIVMLRPTLSPGLHLQMLGRGLRLKTGKHKDCLVLDFAGNCMLHGPVTDVLPPSAKRKSDKIGAACGKECPECLEIVAAATRVCPSCGFEWKLSEKMDWFLFDGDVNGGAIHFIGVDKWAWVIEQSRGGVEQLVIKYQTIPGDIIRQFICYMQPKVYGIAVNLAKTILAEYGFNIADFYLGMSVLNDTQIKVYDWGRISNIMSSLPCPCGVLAQKKPGSPYMNIQRRIYQDEYNEIQEELKRRKELREKADATRKTYLS